MIIACKDTNFYYRRFTMKRSFIFLMLFSLAVVSCGTVGQYSDASRFQDGIYYKAESSNEQNTLANAAGTQFNDKINIEYDEYGWSTATTSSSIVYVPVVSFGYPYYYGYYGYYGYYDPWYYGRSSWYWNDWYWNDWYWHDRYYYHHPHHHGDYYAHAPMHGRNTRVNHEGTSARSSSVSSRVRAGSATRSTSSASTNSSTSTYRRSAASGSTPSTLNGSGSAPRRSATSSSSSSSSGTYRRSSSSSSGNSSSSYNRSSSGSTYRSPSSTGTSRSSGGTSGRSGGSSRGRR